MTTGRLQLICVALAFINFSAMLLYAWGLRWESTAVILILTLDVLAACMVLWIAYKRTPSSLLSNRATRLWFRPRFMLNAACGYALALTAVLLVLHQFSRQAIIFLFAGVMFCFLVAKVSEIVDSRMIEHELL